jgi:hypothetical protein
VLNFTDYITLDESIPSRSQLYANSLPGIDSDMVEGLAKTGKDEDETWAVLYKRACDGLVNDVRKLLNNKFFVDLKLVSRETSLFEDSVNTNPGLAGIELYFNLPKYAAIHIIAVEVKSEMVYDSPELEINIFQDDQDGEVLHTVTSELTEGRNVVNIDRSFYTNKLFIAYDTSFELRNTENRRYATPYISFNCDECRFDCGGYQGKIEQINGGGLNVFYNVTCSIEKFVLENINLFAQALLWKIGIVISEERRYGERLNKYNTMTLERHEELLAFYTEKYNQEKDETIRGVNIKEDPYCFECKQILSKRSSIP